MAPKRQQKREREETPATPTVSPADSAPATTDTKAVEVATLPVAAASSAPAAAIVPDAPQPVATQPKKKNTHRLTRSFRQPKEKIPLRPWRNDASAANALLGVTGAFVAELVGSLTEAEKLRAAQGLDPLTTVEEQMLKRAEKYGALGTDTTTTNAGAAAATTIDPAVIQAREARFGAVSTASLAPSGAPQQSAVDEAIKKREARFASAAPAAQGLSAPSTTSDAAAIEARAKRFTS